MQKEKRRKEIMMFGFNNRRRKNTIIGGGDWDRDGVKNVKDCEPLNWKKQGPKHKKIKLKSRMFSSERQAKIGRYNTRGSTSDIIYDKEQDAYYFEVEEL